MRKEHSILNKIRLLSYSDMAECYSPRPHWRILGTRHHCQWEPGYHRSWFESSCRFRTFLSMRRKTPKIPKHHFLKVAILSVLHVIHHDWALA